MKKPMSKTKKIIYDILFVIALAVFLFSAYKRRIQHGYRTAGFTGCIKRFVHGEGKRLYHHDYGCVNGKRSAGRDKGSLRWK